MKRNFASTSDESSAKLRVTTERETALPKIQSSVTRPDGVTNKLILDAKDWIIVYRFGFIRVARLIQRLKIFQTGFTCCLVLPASVGLFISGNLPVENVLFVLGTSSFACVMLYVMGTICSRLIGAMYVSKTDSSLIRIGHMNFWGKREDQIFNRNEIVPFSEIPDNVSDIYVNVKFYSDPDNKLHLSVRYGTIYNKVKFEEIFGKVDGLKITAVPRNPKSQ
ncbi:unnamed protein product [Orchesella dallaii]|uniref:Transmembrane protein 186 n=1 Tax=Orchesella dallaii TaxID=48710 RepID=A0ABP1Q9A5_9HEXA